MDFTRHQKLEKWSKKHRTPTQKEIDQKINEMLKSEEELRKISKY